MTGPQDEEGGNLWQRLRHRKVVQWSLACIAAGVYRKLDKTLLPNLKNVDPAISRMLERSDPGNQCAVPYVWGSLAFGYDVEKVEAALGGPAPDSWALVFDPKYAAKLAKCGIIVVDAPWVMVSHALTYLGRDPGSERPEELAAALQRLRMSRAHTDAYSRQQNREFTRFRTGQ